MHLCNESHWAVCPWTRYKGGLIHYIMNIWWHVFGSCHPLSFSSFSHWEVELMFVTTSVKCNCFSQLAKHLPFYRFFFFCQSLILINICPFKKRNKWIFYPDDIYIISYTSELYTPTEIVKLKMHRLLYTVYALFFFCLFVCFLYYYSVLYYTCAVLVKLYMSADKWVTMSDILVWLD